MSRIIDFYKYMDSIAPFSTQESWDNSGFLVGDGRKKVTKVLLALDATEDVLNEAAEIGADAILMAKSVDYIYDDDPRKNPNAKPIEEIKASQVLAMNLKALDATATAFCLSTGMPVKLFGLNSPEDIVSAVVDGKCGTVVLAE